MYTIKFNNVKYNYEEKILLKDLAKQFGIECYLAKVNNRLRELNYYVNYNCEVEFLGLNDSNSIRAYEASLRYIIIMALENLYSKVDVKFKQCVSRSIVCYVNGIKDKVDNNFIAQLSAEIRRIIDADYPITRISIPISEALKIYKERGYIDKVEVLKYRTEKDVNIYKCQDYMNYMFGYMIPSTGYLKKFILKTYHPGFIVQYPRAELNGEIPVFEDSPTYGKMLKDAQNWAKNCESDTIPKLNKHATEKSVIELVNMCEAKHNDMLAELGRKIKDNIDDIRLIAIAGPSSSGKTTFSNRLRIELMVRGIKPVKISMDDYYLDRTSAPLDEYGNYDLEHVEALDIELFNNHLLALIQGDEVEMPMFDFRLGKRVRGHKIKIDKNTPIIIEGIHALNERLTSLIPKHQKFKIYISPLVQINIDNHNPISATEIRLLRRCDRDAKYRKTKPTDTFAMWPSVRRGEFKWIYPYQEEADYVFNSELLYELCVMKKYALPALKAIESGDEHFVTANRIVKFLKYFMEIDDKYVPCNSLLREFIGDSCFYDE